jgi:hypothetical protein
MITYLEPILIIANVYQLNQQNERVLLSLEESLNPLQIIVDDVRFGIDSCPR